MTQCTTYGTWEQRSQGSKARWWSDVCVLPTAYNDHVDDWKNPNEDERGVDVTQIRALLRLSVAERVREMVHAANVLMTIRENVQMHREAQSK